MKPHPVIVSSIAQVCSLSYFSLLYFLILFMPFLGTLCYAFISRISQFVYSHHLTLQLMITYKHEANSDPYNSFQPQAYMHRAVLM